MKGQWCETPYFDVAIARMAMDNLSDVRARRGFSELFWLIFLHLIVWCVFVFQRKYTQHHEDTKDQIYFMQTETPVYGTNKKARIAASEVSAQKCKSTEV